MYLLHLDINRKGANQRFFKAVTNQQITAKIVIMYLVFLLQAEPHYKAVIYS